jgi:hypothetical protein
MVTYVINFKYKKSASLHMRMYDDKNDDYSIDVVEIEVATLNYAKDSQILKDALYKIEGMVHAYDTFTLDDEPEQVMGWYFFTLYVNKSLLVRLVNLLGNDFLAIKGKSLEHKFINWLNARIKNIGSDMKLTLKADLMSSRYGLF